MTSPGQQSEQQPELDPVAAAQSRLAALRDRPVDEHPGELAAIDQLLRAALDAEPLPS